MEKPTPKLLADIAKFREEFNTIRKNFYDGIDKLSKMLEETTISIYLKSEKKRINAIKPKLFVVLESIEANLNYWETDKWIVEKEHIKVKVIKE